MFCRANECNCSDSFVLYKLQMHPQMHMIFHDNEAADNALKVQHRYPGF